MTELKPCPFCGVALHKGDYSTPETPYYIHFGTSCVLSGFTVHEDPEEIALWNTRHKSEAEELLEWAENNPEPVIKMIYSWWATAGKGFREEWFNFRGLIEEAREANDE